MSAEEREKDATLPGLPFGVFSYGPGSSEGVRKRHKLVILDVQSSCLVSFIIFLSSHLPEFDKSPLPLLSLSLSLPPSPVSLSLSLSIYVYDDWVVVISTGGV